MLFFIHRFAGVRMRRESEQNLKPYSKWGFYYSYLMLNKENSFLRTSMTKSSRDLVLQDLIKEKSEFSVKDYIGIFNYKIHPRQAERDLESWPQLKPHGQTRNRVYKTNRRFKLFTRDYAAHYYTVAPTTNTDWYFHPGECKQF